MIARDLTVDRQVELAGRVNPPARLDKLDEIIDRYAGRATYLIPVLKDAQDVYGCLPFDVQHWIAKKLRVSPSHVYGVVTFYSFFTVLPRGRHTIRTCLGTACYVKGSYEILETILGGLGINVGETTEDGRFTVEAVRCLGTCGLAPVMLVDADPHAGVAPRKIFQILDTYE